MRNILFICLSFWLVACGQKGALYLPEEGAPVPGAAYACPTCKPATLAPGQAKSGKSTGKNKIVLEPQPQPAPATDPEAATATITDDANNTPPSETTGNMQ